MTRHQFLPHTTMYLVRMFLAASRCKTPFFHLALIQLPASIL